MLITPVIQAPCYCPDLRGWRFKVESSVLDTSKECQSPLCLWWIKHRKAIKALKSGARLSFVGNPWTLTRFDQAQGQKLDHIETLILDEAD